MTSGALADGRGKLRQMAVAETHQRRGVGAALVRFLEDEARRRDMHTVVLHARDHATGFYAALGYQVTGTPFLEVGIPHVRMMKPLPALPPTPSHERCRAPSAVRGGARPAGLLRVQVDGGGASIAIASRSRRANAEARRATTVPPHQPLEPLEAPCLVQHRGRPAIGLAVAVELRLPGMAERQVGALVQVDEGLGSGSGARRLVAWITGTETDDADTVLRESPNAVLGFADVVPADSHEPRTRRHVQHIIDGAGHGPPFRPPTACARASRSAPPARLGDGT